MSEDVKRLTGINASNEEAIATKQSQITGKATMNLSMRMGSVGIIGSRNESYLSDWLAKRK